MQQANTAPPLTRGDYQLLPETGPRYQLIEGDLDMAPAPNRFHQDISRNLGLLIGQYLKETHRYPLLNREQEQKVSRAMPSGK